MSQSGAEVRTRKQVRLAILVNTMAPYRLPIYGALAAAFDTLVLHGGNEANRSWTLDLPPTLKTRRVWTLQIPVKKQTGVTGIWDKQFLHLNLGLLWWLPRFRPDAILTNELGLRTLMALAYGRLARVPVWVQWEGSLHSERNIRRMKRGLRRLMSRCIGRWVSYGASSSEYLLSLGARREHILEVQNCVPHENFVRAPLTSRRWFEGEPAPVILSVGQLIARKGLDRLVDACGRLAARGLEFTLVLVGDGPERDNLRTLAERAGLQHFHLIPNQSPFDLIEIYRSAAVFVLPTLEDVWGLVVSEALWVGLPVLCSKYAGCAEIVPPQNLFDPVSANSFDAALAKIFEGTLAAADRERLMTWQELSESIRRSIVEGVPAVSVTPKTETKSLGSPDQRDLAQLDRRAHAMGNSDHPEQCRR